MFNIKLDSQPEQFLKKSEPTLKKRLFKKIKSLAEEPIPSDAKSVKRRKEKVFRVRVGDHRILYVVFYEDNSILISKIEKRSKVYRK